MTSKALIQSPLGSQEPTTVRRCKHCGSLKPLEAFTRDRHMTLGRTRSCRECVNAKNLDKQRSKPPRDRRKESLVLCADDLRTMFDYDAQSGILTWKSGLRKGQRAGGMNVHGYQQVCIRERDFLVHRVVWCLVYGQWPILGIDHRNGERSDNRISNLREATTKQNLANTPAHATNHCGLKGVHKQNRTGRWRAQIRVDGKHHHLGYFDTPEQAHAAYMRAAREIYGEFVRPSPIENEIAKHEAELKALEESLERAS